MISVIDQLPLNIIGFAFTEEVTKDDFETVVVPAVERYLETNEQINMIIIMDTAIANMSLGAWYEDLLLGLKKLMKWRKLAIVSDEGFAEKASKVMDTVLPGEYKAFGHRATSAAIQWVAM